MFNNLVPVNSDRHAGKRIRPLRDFRHVADSHLASLVAHEFVRAAGTFPVVFVEDRQNECFRPVALLGLEPGENLFVDTEGRWTASYVPAIIRRYPFALAGNPGGDQYTVLIDEGADVVNDEEGQLLFEENGEPAEALENVRRYLGDLQQMDFLTNTCCDFLKEHDLLTGLNMRVRQADQVRNVSGCFSVNEERLNELSDELFLEMRRRGYLAPIYAHLCSLAQIERLAKIKDDRGAASA